MKNYLFHILHKKNSVDLIRLLCTAGLLISLANAQKTASGFLKTEKTIVLSVKGRIDHMDVNLKNQIVYVSALGNNSLEVVDIAEGKVIRSITGLNEPQGVGYIPQTNEILVANGGTGDCYFYNARSFEKTGTIHLNSDADDVRYDSASGKIYVGYGDGGIAVIDAVSHKQLEDIKLPAHPESFQIDRTLNLLFVNVPDAHMVGVVDLKKSYLIKKWARAIPAANFPMALDTINHRVFVGYRHPARLIAYEGSSGQQLVDMDMTGDADDLYYDNGTSFVYVSGGSGSISIYRIANGTVSKQIATIPTRNGARTSLLIPQLKLFVLAERADAGKPADLLIYKTEAN
ncbi:MAG TPA: YncE family protein [Puia sp.]|nr:YncE family protein [Puia sp.]